MKLNEMFKGMVSNTNDLDIINGKLHSKSRESYSQVLHRINTKQWKMLDGTLINVKDMSDIHIFNSANLMLKKIKTKQKGLPDPSSVATKWYKIFTHELTKRNTESSRKKLALLKLIE